MELIKTNELRGLMVAKGMKQYEVAQAIGISPTSMQRKLKAGVFGSDEIEKLIQLLDIKHPEKIFFAKE